MPDTKMVQRQQRLKRYTKEIPLLEERIKLAEQRGEAESFIRRLQKKIAHRKQRLTNGWPGE